MLRSIRNVTLLQSQGVTCHSIDPTLHAKERVMFKGTSSTGDDA